MCISFDRAAEYYDRTRSFPLNVMEKAAQVLEDELKHCMLILDVGVGTGRFAEPLQNLGFEVVGIDISGKMLKKAIGKKVKNLMFADARSLPFPDLTFDASMSVHALHLIVDWRTALREVVRVTRIALFSVLVEGPETSPGDIYKELMKKYGYSYRHPGLGEWDLKKLIKPTQSKFIASFDASIDEDLVALKEKAFSSQWNAPQDIHERAMKELEKLVTVKSYANKVYVHRWDVGEIRNHLPRNQ
nr:class I SAM-dependent methyltransferase [Candidatus Njordarchaeum guaymaensis]